MLDKIIEKKRVFSDIFDRARRNQMSWRSISMRYEKKMKVFSKKRSGLFFPMPLFLFHFPFQSVLLNSSALSPNFFSGIVERAKRELAWKSPHGVSPFPLGWFSRELTFLSLYYPLGKMRTTSGLKPGLMFSSFALFSFLLFCRFIECVLLRLPWPQLFAHLEQKLIKGSCKPAHWISVRPMMHNLLI